MIDTSFQLLSCFDKKPAPSNHDVHREDKSIQKSKIIGSIPINWLNGYIT